MSENTKNLDLFKYDVETDAKSTFDINKALNQNFDKIDSASENFLNKQQITNCILEIPQRIKYTLENGKLTIKAGSVVIVPYGVEDLTSQYPKGSTFINDNFKVYDTQFEDGKFFVWAELINDLSRQEFNEETGKNCYINIVMNTTILSHGNPTRTASGTETVTSSQYYNLTTNMYQFWSTINEPDIRCLPIMVGDFNAGLITSINQVFNGIGYIGSTVWVDKGVKGLIPNGRNKDGTLNNIEFTTSKISTKQTTSTGNLGGYLNINSEGQISLWAKNTSTGPRYYDYNKNFFYGNNSWQPLCTIADLIVSNGAIDTFSLKMGVNILSYTDKSVICGWGMPSSKYINLTLGASGTEYTAPANGYYQCYIGGSSGNKWLRLFTTGNYLQEAGFSTSNNIGFTVPIQKGQTLNVKYSGTLTVKNLMFIYAEGEV